MNRAHPNEKQVVGGTGHLNVGHGVRLEANPHVFALPEIAKRWWTDNGTPAPERWRVTQLKVTLRSRAIEIIYRTDVYKDALRYAIRVSDVMRKRNKRLTQNASELLEVCKEAYAALPVRRQKALRVHLLELIKTIEPEWEPEK